MIRLRFSTAFTPADCFVRFATRSSYSHVDFITDNGLLGSRPAGGVMVRPFEYEPAMVLRADADPEPVLTAVRSQLGKPYDFTAVVGQLLFARDWASTARWFCSELVA